MLQNAKVQSNKEYSDGLNTTSNIFSLTPGQSPNAMNVKFEDGSLIKIYGTKTMNASITANTGGWGSFDFGSGESTRNLMVGAGTGIYYSTDLGLTWVGVATSRTVGRMYFQRVKQYCISTTEARDAAMYWAGSNGTYMLTLSTSAPLCKKSIEFSGYLFLMNSSTDKRQIYYEDINTMIAGSFTNSFSLPSSKDDEITDSIVYRKKLYVATRYKIFRVTWVGGNPDFEYKEVKDFGVVSGTMKVANYKDKGEVIIMMSWDKRIRIFDGSDDLVISDNIENDNGICEFALEKIQDGKISHTSCEVDVTENFYKLGLAIAPSNLNTHIASLNLKSGAWQIYRYGTPFLSMVSAESGNRSFLMMFDYYGFCHMADTSNTIAGTGINDWYKSPIMYNKTPNVVSKKRKINLYFDETSSGTLQYNDALNFNRTFTNRDTISLTEANSVSQIEKTINLPITCNVYQYEITSNSNKANPWKLNRIDISQTDMGVGEA